MRVRIITDVPAKVMRELTKRRLAPSKEATVGGDLILTYTSDREYRELLLYMACAIGCGLIDGFRVG